MSAFLVEGGNRLTGSVRVHGAKNSVLPILAAAILGEGESVIHNCPDLSDVAASLEILRHLGCKAVREGDTITVDASHLTRCDVPDELMREMRSSVIFLGAILGQGLDREKVGDILVRPGVCDVLVFRELCPFLLQNWDGAGRAKLKVEEIGLEEVAPPLVEVRTHRDTVSSPRLDAVMASGFSMGRGKAAGLISSGKVELNHRPCVKPDRAVEQGDVITCRGLGKCLLKEMGGVSKKGRIMLVLERYV